MLSSAQRQGLGSVKARFSPARGFKEIAQGLKALGTKGRLVGTLGLEDLDVGHDAYPLGLRGSACASWEVFCPRLSLAAQDCRAQRGGRQANWGFMQLAFDPRMCRMCRGRKRSCNRTKGAVYWTGAVSMDSKISSKAWSGASSPFVPSARRCRIA